MGVFTKKSSRSRHGKLPIYEKVTPSYKERNSDDSYEDYESDEYSEPSSPNTNISRGASSSSSTPMLSKRILALPRRPRAMLYRMPNRITRYLCMGLVLTILLFMYSLVRASQNENKKLAEGKIEKSPPAPFIWETYPFLTRYYGGLKNLVPFKENSPEYPRPEDEAPLDKLSFLNGTASPDDLEKRATASSLEFVSHPKSVFKTAPEEFNECFIDSADTIRVPPIRYYNGRPSGFPEAVLGSYDLLDLPEDICYERYGRYGPYGYGYSVRSGGLSVGEYGERMGADSTWEAVPEVDWRTMDWADAQKRCYQSNAARYKRLPKRIPQPHGFYIDEQEVDATTLQSRDSSATGELETRAKSAGLKSESSAASTTSGKKMGRSALVIRCWDEYFFREDDLMNIRSLITELALASGGRYDVHLLVQVKNDAMYPIWADAQVYEQRIKDRIPAEFRGLVTLWTETQMLSLYQGIHDLFARGPDLPVHGVYRGLLMAMQHFAYLHPEYDYYWQWEMDIRYTGHYYDLFTKVESFAREQPRKGLWERNGRFYFPTVHGSWEDFKQMARVQTEMGTFGADKMWDGLPGSKKPAKAPASGHGEKPIWGPERPKDEEDWFESENDPEPPTSYEKDKFEWGVGEEADLITFNPMFDPEGTTWGLADDITGYNTTEGQPPRRAQIITASRMSRRLLMTMHRETAFKKHFAFPEMWPATAALQHGYKAVFVPHPVYVDREWPTAVFAQTLNNGRNGASGGSRNAVYGDGEHNMRGMTWFYDSGFAPNLYRRWLGLKVNNDGGEEFEMNEDKSKTGDSVTKMRGGEGRMCLPPMLLHPIKDVELPSESDPEELKEIPESDPSA